MNSILTYLSEIERRADAATPPPWRTTHEGMIIQAAHITRDVWTIPHREEDLPFIAASRTDVPRLTRALRRAVEGLTSQLSFAKTLKCTCCVANEAGDVDRCGACWDIDELETTLSAIEEELKL